jgi:hypothetical protein
MTKTTETGDMPDPAFFGVIIIAIQFPLIKQTTAPCAPVIILTKTVNRDNCFPNILDRINTGPMPFTTLLAEDKPLWDPISLNTSKILRLSWRRLSPSVGDISEDIPTLLKGR